MEALTWNNVLVSSRYHKVCTRHNTLKQNSCFAKDQACEKEENRNPSRYSSVAQNLPKTRLFDWQGLSSPEEIPRFTFHPTEKLFAYKTPHKLSDGKSEQHPSASGGQGQDPVYSGRDVLPWLCLPVREEEQEETDEQSSVDVE